MNNNQYDDIRSYRDSEVLPTLDRLYNDKEFYLSMKRLMRTNAPKLSFLISILFWAVWPLIWKRLTKGIHDVHSMQMAIKALLLKALKTSSDGVECSGLSQLDGSKPYLFISNHRDIAMDPALINLMVSDTSLNIPHLAIGDNLLSKPYATDLMRLNRSFIVKRNIAAGRKLLLELKHLSSYIRHLRDEVKTNVWIAQREGRAKDGIDGTEEAVLKMLLLSADKDKSLADKIIDLNIVPVAISYEWDPCDISKAKSLIAVNETGNYIKDEHEDIVTIGQGISGYKGKIQVNFMPCIERDFESTEDLAAYIDQQIIANYRLFPSHFAACELLNIDYGTIQCLPDKKEIDAAKLTLQNRIDNEDDNVRQQVLHLYANSVINHINTVSTQIMH